MTEQQVQVRIGPVSASDPALAALVEAHIAHAKVSTPPENVYALGSDELGGPGLSLSGLWQGEVLAAMGALRRLSETDAEIKSMHVGEGFRNRGLARKMLEHLIAEAEAAGIRRLWLETGATEDYAPARQLYVVRGFRECGPFADYPQHPNSIFMRLDLTP